MALHSTPGNMMFSHLPYAVVYLDDILVFSKSQTEHQGHLRTVLSILKENHCHAKLSKCRFYQSSKKFLGFVVDKDGIRMDPDKVSAVVKWPLPTSTSELSSFLGLSNHYKRFLHDYSRKIAAFLDPVFNSGVYPQATPCVTDTLWLCNGRGIFDSFSFNLKVSVTRGVACG